MNLTELRSLVRAQTQTTQGDLPDPTVDAFLQQGFERTINGETQWPFYETSWDITLDPNTSTITIPGDVNQAGIMALYDVANNFRLTQVANEFAADHFLGPQVGSTWAFMYSLWGNEIQVYPWNRETTYTKHYRLRGYRRPLNWLTPAQEPDCDARLHVAISHYAVALAYAQQEDEQLEAVYMERWQRDAEAARRAIMEPRHQRPLVFAGSISMVPRWGASWVIDPP